MANMLQIQLPSATLSKSQKEFNRLIAKIEKTRADIQLVQHSMDVLRQRAQQELLPILHKSDEQQAASMHLFDHFLTREKTSKSEKEKVEYILMSIIPDLIDKGFEDLKPVFERHSGGTFEEFNEDAELATAAMMKELISQMYGIEFDEDADVSTPEKMEAYIRTRYEVEEAKAAKKSIETQEPKAQKPKTEKQLEREAAKAERERLKAEAEKKVTQSVRGVYMDLVKTFHPDLEQGEEEKIRKTAIMQRVTEAYENNDLLQLLMLQMELERIDQSHIENLSEERLLIFNKVLRSQSKELSDTLGEMCFEIGSMFGFPNINPGSISVLDNKLTQDIKAAKKALKSLQEEHKSLQSTENMRRYIKAYKIPKIDPIKEAFFRL